MSMVGWGGAGGWECESGGGAGGGVAALGGSGACGVGAAVVVLEDAEDVEDDAWPLT